MLFKRMSLEKNFPAFVEGFQQGVRGIKKVLTLNYVKTAEIGLFNLLIRQLPVKLTAAKTLYGSKPSASTCISGSV